MAKQQATRVQQDEGETPSVRTPEDSQLAVRGDGTPIDAQTAVANAAATNEQAMQTFITWLTERADTTDADQFTIMASIMADIMSATNVAEALAEKSALKAEDVVGQPLLLHGFEIRAGEYEDSLLQHYAALTVSRPGMEQTRILTVGATKVLMRLYMLDQFGEWPQLIMFTSKPHRKGNIIDIVQP